MFTYTLSSYVYCIKKPGPDAILASFTRTRLIFFIVLTALFVLASATAAGWFFSWRFFSLFTVLCIGATCTGCIAASAGCASRHCQARTNNQACNAQAGQQFLQLLFVHINPLR
jgi:uncharacterized integral membrane protein